MCSVVGIVLFDETAIAITLPRIRDHFQISATEANWILSAYLLSLSATVAAFGRLADLVGRRRVVIGGSLLFGVMSMAAGLAPDYPTLVAARAVQGLGASLSVPTLGVFVVTPPPDFRGLYIAASAVSVLAFGIAWSRFRSAPVEPYGAV